MKHLPCLALLGLALYAPPGRANDGGISWGGSPSLLKSHPSIAMEREAVTITVGESDVVVDCRFVFKNNGSATTVRMGFPDDGQGESGFYASPEEWKKEKPVGRFKWFKSWVDGKATKTTLERSSEVGKLWHAKAVSFKTGARRVVRDQYSVPIGSQIARNGLYYQTAYTLHTGSSWAGTIGRSEITVNFSRPLGSAQVRAIPYSKVPFVVENGEKDFLLERAMKPGVVVVSSGPGTPTARGKSLRWVRTNWRPTEKDDLLLLFDFKTVAQMQAQSSPRPRPLPYIDVFPIRRRLGASDIDGLTPQQIRLVRNAIYARYGRPFQDAALSKYFKNKNWYRARSNWTQKDEARLLSQTDAANAEFLLGLQAE